MLSWLNSRSLKAEMKTHILIKNEYSKEIKDIREGTKEGKEN